MVSALPGHLPAIFTYRKALTAGLTKFRFYALRDAGAIETVARGLYRRADSDEMFDLDLVEIARRARHATLCLTSALARHDLTDAIPCTIDVALPSGSYRPAVIPPVSWHLFDRSTFDIGRETMPLGVGHHIGIFTAERCIIDAFRLRHREGEDLAYIALRRWLRRRGSSPAALCRMARHFPQATAAVTRAVTIFLYE